jgi:hypothetical protein
MSRPNPVKSFKHANDQYQKRHHNCSYYSKCLDKAAKKNWENFTCKFCVIFKKYNKRSQDIAKYIK